MIVYYLLGFLHSACRLPAVLTLYKLAMHAVLKKKEESILYLNYTFCSFYCYDNLHSLVFTTFINAAPYVCFPELN